MLCAWRLLTTNWSALLIVSNPSLATHRTHFPDVIYVDDRVTMYPLELRLPKAVFDCAQGLAGQQPLLHRDDPNQLSFRLKREHVIRVQKVVFGADPSHHLTPGCARRLVH